MCLWRVSDELQDELCFPAAIFLGRLTHAVPGCKPPGISHTEMKPGRQKLPAWSVRYRSQVEPFRAEPSEGSADRINVCVCVRVGDSVWDSVPKRVREGSTVYLPQQINKKKVGGNDGFSSHLLGDHRSLVS